MTLNSGNLLASRFWLAVMFVVATATGKACAVQDEDVQGLVQRQIGRIAEKFQSSLVQIEMTGGPEGQVVRTTGTLIDNQGFLLTHATGLNTPPDNILVTDHQGQAHVGKWVAVDHIHNLLLIKIEPLEGVVLFPLLDPDQVSQGQTVLALGKMLDPRSVHVSQGIVSATGRIWGKAIQTDAKVSPLNYGGPLLDLQGRLLGILVPLALDPRQNKNGLQWYDSGIGFAVPLAGYQQRLDQLKKGLDVQQGLSGIQLGTTNNNAAKFPVERIRAGSPAYGILAAGDQIVEINGTPTKSVADYYHQYFRLAVGDRMEVRWQRDEETLSATLELVAELEPVEFLVLGCLSRETPQGLEVLATLPGSSLSPGDVIVQVNQHEVKRSAQLESILLETPLPEPLPVSVQRGGQTVELSLPPVSLTRWIPESNWVQPLLPTASAEATVTDVAVPGLPAPASLWRVPHPATGAHHSPPLLVWLRDSLQTEATLKQQWKSWAESFGFSILVCGPQEQKWTADDSQCVTQYIQQVQADHPELLGRSRVLIAEGDAGGIASSLLSQKDPQLLAGVFLESSADTGDLSSWENLPGQRRMFLHIAPGKEIPSWIPFFNQQKIPAVHLQQDREATLDWKTTLGLWIWSTRIQ